MSRTIGVLTAGGDSPGFDAAIRAVGKAAQRAHGMEVLGFKDGPERVPLKKVAGHPRWSR